MSAQSKSLGFLAAPPKAAPLPPEKIPGTYRSMRLQVFTGIFLGYAGFYLIRNNVSLVAAILKENDLMNTVGIGIVANAVLFAYGLSSSSWLCSLTVQTPAISFHWGWRFRQS